MKKTLWKTMLIVSTLRPSSVKCVLPQSCDPGTQHGFFLAFVSVSLTFATVLLYIC